MFSLYFQENETNDNFLSQYKGFILKSNSQVIFLARVNIWPNFPWLYVEITIAVIDNILNDDLRCHNDMPATKE